MSLREYQAKANGLRKRVFIEQLPDNGQIPGRYANDASVGPVQSLCFIELGKAEGRGEGKESERVTPTSVVPR